MTVIKIIAAVAANGVIGTGDRLPWNLPDDLAYFAACTRDTVVVVGQTTFRTLPPLPLRTVVVVSRRGNRVVDYNYAGVPVKYRLRGNTLDDALNHADALSGALGSYWVIGGARIYEQTLLHAAELHITHVHDTPPGDTWFPRFDPRDWVVNETARGDGWTRCVYTERTICES